MKHINTPSVLAGENLKRLIKEAGMTQAEAAEMLGYSEDRQIRRMMKNGIKNADEVQRIAECFNVVPWVDMYKPID